MKHKQLVGMVKYGSYADAFKDVSKQMETQHKAAIKKIKKEAKKRSESTTPPKL